MNSGRKIEARRQPNNCGHQVTYEIGTSRKVYRFEDRTDEELSPHGAGSYHDPAHHNQLMDRLEDYIRNNQKTQ
ncbi:MAG: hypothetical protein AAF065_14410 [Verrucomicrobiota bacterium]